MIEYRLRFAELILQICSERELKIEKPVHNFIDDGTKVPDITIFVLWDWDDSALPKEGFVGEDSISNYYKVDNIRYCVLKSGYKGEFAYTIYDEELKVFRCVINDITFKNIPRTIGMIMRMLPMKEIFIHYGILFFHASQIIYKGKGIMFTAPSGTGKTTQAKLWRQYRDAEIICNDRTLVRKMDGKWYTYGYPIDGSEPVRSSAVTELACPVVLAQAEDNVIEKLGVAKATTSLMSQLVLDGWNVDEKNRAMDMILSLVEEYPVYLLKCTKDESAVKALEKVLTDSKII